MAIDKRYKKKTEETKMKTEEVKYGVISIFPTPVYMSNDIKKITKRESDFVEKCKSKTHRNQGNTTTLDSYILQHDVFRELKNIIEQHLKTYLQEVICPAEKNIKIYITQSWIYYTNINEFHHEHDHDNSFLSGVFYLKANRDVDGIHFKKPPSGGILSLTPKKTTVYNSTDWGFKVSEGTLLIFPSKVHHYVALKKEGEERISLSFNTFIEGAIGDANQKTQLTLLGQPVLN